MPSVRCPACGSPRPVERAQFGRSVQCKHCRASFKATAPRFDFLSGAHPAGRRVGLGLLIAAVAALAWPALGMLLRGPRSVTEPGSQATLLGALVAAALGWLLLLRHRRAVDREERARAEAIA